MHALLESWPIVVSIAGGCWFLATRMAHTATKDDLHQLDVRLARIEGRLNLPPDNKVSAAE